MENRVGDSTPSAKTRTQQLATLNGTFDGWKPYGVTLSSAQRHALLHARLGAEPHMARIYDIAKKYGVEVEGVPLQGMKNDLALMATLRPFQDAYAAGVTLFDHTAAQAASEGWNAYLAYYGGLRGMAKHQPTLARELAPVVDFMKTGTGAVAEAPAAAPAEPQPAAPAAPAAAPARSRATGRRTMENKVGDDMPSEAEAARMLAGTKGVTEAWMPYGVLLTPAQRKALHHPRLGAEPHIERVHALATKYKLDIDGIPLQGMTNDFALVAMLRPFQDAMRAGQHLVEDTAGQAESEAWEAFLAYYGTLCGIAKHHAAIAEELAPIIAFMSNRPKGG
jgi:hypothetical protein